ncbi:MAG: 50S ribosomal protein L23 [Rhabdochlamydiaceae bacterium]|jgi:large subunit ribosomal protein L23
MLKKNPYDIIKSRHITEKSRVLQNLYKSSSNRCVRKCETPKYVFLVDTNANKREIAKAIEEIHAEKNIKVISVNTINVKPKRRTVRGRSGMRNALKKAIVTLKAGDFIEDKV